MPVLDGSFEAFVTNLGKYNEGELVGEWVHFPTTEEEMKKVFERIGIGSKDEFGQVYEEWFITDYDCSIHGVSNLLGEYENLDKLNYLAARLDEMSRSELEHFVAIMDSGCDEVNDLDDLINLTYNLDNYDFIPDIKDYDDLGRYYFFEGGYNIDNKFGSFVDYIDFERYGEDCAINEGGTLTDAGYIRPTGDSWNRYFDGTLEDIPDEYRVTGSGEELEPPSTIAVLVVEPDKKPYVKEIPSSLESLQHEVGGDIEAVYPFEEPVAIVCNEEGKMNGAELNRAIYSEPENVEMSYQQLKAYLRQAEKDRSHTVGYIVFTADSFDKSYTEEERTYVVGSNNKAFIEGMGGYSIYASSLDGSDKNVRLEAYMADEYGGKDGWKIEKCYVKDESNREMLDIIAGKFFIAYAPIESEKLLSMPKDLMKKYEDKFKYPEHFYQTDNGIVAKAYKPVSKDMER